MPSEVFISHAQTSTSAAKKLADALRARGVSSWGDGERPPNGGPWRTVTREALDQSRAVVFLIEPRGEPGSRVRDEWSEALQAGWDQPSKRLIPVLIEDAEVPAFLYDRHALRVTGAPREWERAADDVVDALRDDGNLLGTIDPAAAERARPEAERRLREFDAVVAELWPRE